MSDAWCDNPARLMSHHIAMRVARALVTEAYAGHVFCEQAMKLAQMCGPSFGGQRMRQAYMYALGYLDARKETSQ